MYTHESTALEEAYDHLISDVSLENIYAFLKACWLIEEGQTLIETTLERMVYTEGDQQEVYTRLERRIISSIASIVFYRNFQLESSAGRIFDCRFLVIELKSETNAVYDSIAIMKILNKAFDGLNLFMFITTSEIHFGSSLLSSQNSSKDCKLSYAINENTNWELLVDILLYRNNSENIFDFYSGMVSVIDEIRNCHRQDCEDINEWKYIDFENYYDGDLLEEDKGIDVSTFFSLCDNKRTEVNEKQAIHEFEQEIDICMCELSGIKKAHVNPLEMLYEAEKASLTAELQETISEHNDVTFETSENSLDFELLDDPIALMKKLKKDRGL